MSASLRSLCFSAGSSGKRRVAHSAPTLSCECKRWLCLVRISAYFQYALASLFTLRAFRLTLCVIPSCSLTFHCVGLQQHHGQSKDPAHLFLRRSILLLRLYHVSDKKYSSSWKYEESFSGTPPMKYPDYDKYRTHISRQITLETMLRGGGCARRCLLGVVQRVNNDGAFALHYIYLPTSFFSRTRILHAPHHYRARL